MAVHNITCKLKASWFVNFFMVFLLLCFTNYRSSSQDLQFKIMVLNKAFLKNTVFTNGVTEVYFQHSNPKVSNVNRLRYHLIAYKKNPNSTFTKISSNNLFATRTQSPRFKLFDATSSFGNLILKSSDLATNPADPGPSHPFIILYPQLMQTPDPNDIEYVFYEMYYAKSANEPEQFVDKKRQIKGIKIQAQLNPSPPR